MTTNRKPAFSLAPAAIVRVASWPLDDLVALGDPALARRAAQVDLESAATLEADYEASVEANRARLWATTVADPGFRAALVLSSPDLHRQLGAGRRSQRRNKAARHLDTSLVRYLSRACVRTEPFGLWTGVTLARLGDDHQTRFDGCPARARLAPELEPWRALVRKLAEREPYRGRGPWRLNPTLREAGDGRWSYARRQPNSGALRWRSLPEPIAAGLRRALEGRSGSLDHLREHLRAELGEAGDGLLELCVEQGLLVGGLSFPARYEDPWEALAIVETQLEREHATSWADVRRRARARCEQLASRLDAALAEPRHAGDELVAAQLAEAVDEVDRALAELVAELAGGLGLEPPADARSCLRCDLAAPWTVELGREDRDRLEQILADWSALERRHQVAARRRTGAAARLRACPDGAIMAAPATTDDRPTHPATEPPDLDADGEAGPPLGAMVLRAGVDGLARPWLRGLSDVPTATHARHAYHLAERGDPLLPWFRAQYREFAREGVEVVDLAYEHEASPNLLSRPRYVPAVVAPWSGEHDRSLSADASLVAGPRPGSLLVHAGGRRMSLHAFTATATPPEDPILERLLASSFDQRADQLRALAEGPHKAASEAPRETSTRTAILEPNRVELGADEVGSLAAVRRFERYRRWQRLVATYELPELVRVCIGGRPGLVIPTSSPLAVEAAFEGLRADSVVVVEQVLERGWLPGPRGAHVAELVMPLRRRDHSWRSLEVEAPAQAQRCPEAEGWLQLNIAWTGERGQAGPFFRGLAEALNRWRSRAPVERWFVRKSPGLRLRLRGAGFDADAHAELDALIEAERLAGRVQRCWRSTYEPERDRLGGDAVLPAVHAWFSADTDVWSDWIELEARGRTRLRPAWMSLALQADLFGRGTESPEEAWAIWAALHRLYAGRPPSPPTRRSPTSLADRTVLSRLAGADEQTLLARGFEANTRLLAALRDAEPRELLIGGARALLATLAGFHWNRWGLDQATIASSCAAMVADLHPALAFEWPEVS